MKTRIAIVALIGQVDIYYAMSVLKQNVAFIWKVSIWGFGVGKR